MNEFNWVAQDDDGEIYGYDRKPIAFSDRAYSGRNTTFKLIVKGRPNPDWKDTLIDLSKNDYIIKDGILMATRKHAALIHAWADGAVIQYKNSDGKWVDVFQNNPSWHDGETYRIKPKTTTVKFRNWYSTDGKVYGTYSSCECNNPDFVAWIDEDWREVEIEL